MSVKIWWHHRKIPKVHQLVTSKQSFLVFQHSSCCSCQPTSRSSSLHEICPNTRLRKGMTSAWLAAGCPEGSKCSNTQRTQRLHPWRFCWALNCFYALDRVNQLSIFEDQAHNLIWQQSLQQLLRRFVAKPAIRFATHLCSSRHWNMEIFKECTSHVFAGVQ